MLARRGALIALCFGLFMVMLDVTIVNVALPSLASQLGANLSDLQWVIDGYTLTFACLLLSAGNLGDFWSSKQVFLSGLWLFVFSSLGCALSPSLGLLIFFRLLQGIAAALVSPTSIALINLLYDHPQQRAHAIGIWGAIGGIAVASGPLFGGFLIHWFNWRVIFLLNIPVGLLGILLSILYVPNVLSKWDRKFDMLGQLLAIVTSSSLAFSIIEAGKIGWFSPFIITGLLLALLSLMAFIVTEYCVASPMLPLQLFKSRHFSITVLIGLLFNLGFYAELFLLPLYFQQIRDYSILATGLAIFPQSAVVAGSSYFGGKMASHVNPKWPMMIGLSVGTLGFFMLLLTQEHTPPYYALVIPLMTVGFGIAFTMPAATIMILHAAPKTHGGTAAGILNMSRQMGTLLGVAMAGSIVNLSASFISGMHYVFGLSGVVFALASCLSFTL